MITTKEAAERFGVSIMRVRALIYAGSLPSQQFGRDHLIKESDLALVKTYGKAGRPKKEEAPAIAAVKPAVKKPTKKATK